MANNKSGINPISTEIYKISANDIVQYLENQLGFKVVVGFTRWMGVTVDNCYMNMNVAMAPKDVIAKNTSQSYVDTVLEQYDANIKFKDNVIATIKPYMYPEKFANIRTRPEELNKMTEIGITGPRLEQLIRFSTLVYDRQANAFAISLRAEKIIADMLADRATNEIDGEFYIVNVTGKTKDTFRWDVAIDRSSSSTLNGLEVSLDRIFS